MKQLVFLIAFAFSSIFATQAIAQSKDIIVITSPINWQTVFEKTGTVRVSFRVNATTLYVIPKSLVLFINDIPQKEVPVGTSRFFMINGVPNGKYKVQIAAYGPDKRIVASSEPVTFTMHREGYTVSASQGKRLPN